ncbi:MAG: RDD family protein, partial [Burkholderiales bacterium]
YAGFWSRFAALIVDNAILTIFGLALLIAAAFVGAGAVAIANLVFIVIAFLYWPLMESSERQATLGKQLLGIQVSDANGIRLTFVRSLLRNIAKILSSLPFGLGFLLAAFTARKQALHDLITKCLVVRAGPSSLLKAVGATVGALVISIGGGYYYFTEIYLPQMTQETGQQMEQAMKEAQKGAPAAKPAPAQPPVAQAPTPAPAPAAQPAPDQTAPGEPKLMTPQEIAEFEKRMEQTAREPAKVAAATAPAPGPAPAPEQKPAAPVKTKPAPAQPVPAPVAKESAPKPAAAPAAKAKPERKPAAVPAAKPKPAPVAEASAALVSEPPAPPPAPRAAEPKPAEPAAGVVAPAPTRVRSPRFNDVMTAVMYRDIAAATELLELGWWVDRPDSNGVTPLMAAAWIGDPAMAQLLLKGGADPNRRGPGGSVLDYAVRSGDTLIIEMLKGSGAR